MGNLCIDGTACIIVWAADKYLTYTGMLYGRLATINQQEAGLPMDQWLYYVTVRWSADCSYGSVTVLCYR